MKTTPLPSLPCTFGSTWNGQQILFGTERLEGVKEGSNNRLSAKLLYAEIQMVEVLNAPSILGISVGYTTLRVSNTTHDYYRVGDEPLIFHLSTIQKRQWSILLKLLQEYAPQARFNADAMSILTQSAP